MPSKYFKPSKILKTVDPVFPYLKAATKTESNDRRENFLKIANKVIKLCLPKARKTNNTVK